MHTCAQLHTCKHTHAPNWQVTLFFFYDETVLTVLNRLLGIKEHLRDWTALPSAFSPPLFGPSTLF